MIISCERCLTSYVVPDAAIGPQGRNVKCAKCSHTWFAQPGAGKTAEKTIEKTAAKSSPAAIPVTSVFVPPIPEGSALPVIVNQNLTWPLKLTPIFLFLILSLLALTFYSNTVVRYVPILGRYYYALGITTSNHFVLNDFSVQRIVESGKPAWFVSGKLINDSNKERYFPIIRITIQDKNYKWLASYDLQHNENFIKSHEEYPIATTVQDLPTEAEYINVKIGNSLELLF